MICESGRGERHEIGAVEKSIYVYTRANRRVGELVACPRCARELGEEARAAGAHVDARLCPTSGGAELLIDWSPPRKGKWRPRCPAPPPREIEICVCGRAPNMSNRRRPSGARGCMLCCQDALRGLAAKWGVPVSELRDEAERRAKTERGARRRRKEIAS